MKTNIKDWTNSVKNIFLVGSPRSGTTWLQAMLATHPDIHTGIETHFFKTFSHFLDSGKRIRGRKSGLAAYLTPEQVNELVREIFKAVISNLPDPKTPPKYFLEKTPSHCHYVNYILDVFPEAKFIHLIRDGRMVAHSMLEMSKKPYGYWAPDTIDKAAKKWISSVKASREIKALVDESQYYELKYEALRAEPQKNLQPLFHWLNIEIDASYLNEIIIENSYEAIKQKGNRVFNSISSPRFDELAVNQETKRVLGKGNFQAGDYGLTKLQKDRFDFLAGNLLIELDYGDVNKKFSVINRLRTSRRLRKWLRLKQL